MRSLIPLENVTVERVRESLAYDPETGHLLWRIKAASNTQIGGVAGYRSGQGYVRVRLDGTLYLAHRLVWLHYYGVWPKDQIDHKNRNKADNRISNLREATNAQNHRNFVRKKRMSKTGFAGVYRQKNGKFYFQLTRQDGSRLSSSPFTDAGIASEARQVALREHHGEFAIIA